MMDLPTKREKIQGKKRSSLVASRRRLTRHNAGDVGDNDGLAEHRSVENVADSSVRRLPHFLQLELCIGNETEERGRGRALAKKRKYKF